MKPMTLEELSKNLLILQKQVVALALALRTEVKGNEKTFHSAQDVFDKISDHMNDIFARLEVVEDRAAAAWQDKE